MMDYDIKKLTIEEKLSLLTGATAWQTNDLGGKLRKVFFSDGPHGLRKRLDENTTVSATAMPSLSLLANTWNRDLAYLEGETIANDCCENDVDVLLAPGVNIKRTPLCGRNFEYFSEDPFLAGELASSYINGVQSKGIGTSLKHYCMNNRDTERLYQSSEADERTIREIYLKPFEIVIAKSKPWTVMCSYNLVNGVFASENKWLLNDILRKDLGFGGLIVSDWGAVKNPYKSVKATLDLEMPVNKKSYALLKNAYDRGLLYEEEIDACVQNIFNLMKKCEQAKNLRKINYSKSQRHENAVKIAKEGIVLLKNNGTLPLNYNKITVVGNASVNPVIGGGGSSKVQTEYVPNALCEQLKKHLPSVQFEYVHLSHSNGNLMHSGACYISAYNSDAVIICVKSFGENEGGDRTDIKLSQIDEDFILNVCKVNKNVIVCVYAGSAIDMSKWIDEVSAVVYVGYAGEGVHEALAPILAGEISPSGKLAETFPINIEEAACGKYDCNGFVEYYSDGLLVGYRHYDENPSKILFPFGYGISYACFEYSDLHIEKKSETDYEISYLITNNSDVDAKEISQVYVRDVFSYVKRPYKELKGFSKDLIKAHETVKVTVQLDKSAFAYYSIPNKGWYVENGDFEIMVGSSSRDIKLIGRVVINQPSEQQFSVEYVDMTVESVRTIL